MTAIELIELAQEQINKAIVWDYRFNNIDNIDAALKFLIPDYWLRPDVMGSLAKTTKRCGGYCCRSCAGPTIQELKHIDPEFVRVVNEEFWNIL